MKSENKRLAYEQLSMKEKIKENKDKIKMNKQLPYLVGNVVEVCRSWEHDLSLKRVAESRRGLIRVIYVSS
jgi:ATP-dependent 26S proteasome regulatory subunit